jgi:hypothetical protein
MKTYTAKIKGISPYSQSKHVTAEPMPKEGKDAYEARTWRERLHTNEDGFVVIPPMALKNCMAEAAKYLSIQIPGKGKSTYTKHIEAGTLVTDHIVLGIKKDEVPGEWFFVPSDGKRGGDKRVNKCFPVIHDWGGEFSIYVFDETVTQDVLMQHLEEAGKFIGIGRFRPRNNGFYGRFRVDSLEEV